LTYGELSLEVADVAYCSVFASSAGRSWST